MKGLLLFYALVSLEEFFLANKVLDILRPDPISQLQPLDLWLHNREISNDPSQTLQPIQLSVITIASYLSSLWHTAFVIFLHGLNS